MRGCYRACRVPGVLPGWCESGVRAACCRDQEARGSYDLGSYQGLQDHQKAAGIVFQDTASVLFGGEGRQVTDAGAGAEGTLEAWAVTDHPAAAPGPQRVPAPGAGGEP